MKKLFALILVLALTVSLTACSGEKSKSPDSPETSDPVEKPTVDPSGAQVKIPDEIETIGVLSPAVAEVLVALGCGEQIVVYDAQSEGLEGLPTGVPVLDMLQPDMEQLAALLPDVLFVSNMTMYDQSNPYEQLIEMGVCVLCVPSADSIADIQDGIVFIAAAMGKAEEGEKLVGDMQAELERISKIAKTITDKKTVYFEIAAAPDMYSFGSGVFLNEMLELIGAENVLADQEGWLRVEGETIAVANPDVILTNVNYLEDPVGEILSRSGWEGVNAILNKQVYAIDNMSSSLGNQNIVKALDQMAKAVYPDVYGE